MKKITLIDLLNNKNFEDTFDNAYKDALLSGLVSSSIDKNLFVKAFSKGYIAGYNSLNEVNKTEVTADIIHENHGGC